MTLYRQLLIWSFSILLFLCAGLWAFELVQTRNFLEKQLQSHAQDGATSLGLSITSVTGGKDAAIMESMTSALFDAGFYKVIRIYDLSDNVLIDKSIEIKIKGVPDWFVRLIPLQIPGGNALIMDGWQQSGAIYIESNPGYAYSMLWQSALSDLIWLSCTFLLTAFLGSIALKKLLSPLKTIEQQAIHLTNRKFLVQDPLPKTRELKAVAHAMNRATIRLQEIFNEQASLADSLINKLYQDPLTQIGNRRYVEEQIKTKIEGNRKDIFGAFLIVQIEGLQLLNQIIGYQKADRIIVSLTAILKKFCEQIPGSILGRINGTDFAILLPHTELAQARDFTQNLIAELNQQVTTELPDTDIRISCGGAFFHESTTFTQLASRADASLNQSKTENNRRVILDAVNDPDQTLLAGKTETKSALESLIDKRDLLFFLQPVFKANTNKDVLHYEILSRFIDKEDRIVSIGTLIPIAEQTGLIPTLDKIILEELYGQITKGFHGKKFAVNLSPISVANEQFLRWFPSYLQKIKDKNILLYFEFPESRAIRLENVIKNFAETVKYYGHAIGIDHFGQGLTNLRYVNAILPEYVKIDRSVTNTMQSEGDESYFLINTLCNVAHSLEIKTIIEGIETEQQIALLKHIHVDAVQGFYYQRPERLNS